MTHRIEVLRQMNGTMLITANGHVAEIADENDPKLEVLAAESGVPLALIGVHITRMLLG